MPHPVYDHPLYRRAQELHLGERIGPPFKVGLFTGKTVACFLSYLVKAHGCSFRELSHPEDSAKVRILSELGLLIVVN